jgi:hypothetical protein
LADRLQRALQAVSVTPPALTNAYPIQGNGRDTILELTPRVRFEDLVLTLPARAEGKQLVEEHVRADVLRAHGYEPRHKVLLSGPPGNGKTSYAEAVAEALALPFFVVRYDALIGSYLGETNTRLRKLFDYVRTQSCVLFFDEFDSIGKERGDTHETGEIKRVVSFLLMQIDQLPSYVLTIGSCGVAEIPIETGVPSASEKRDRSISSQNYRVLARQAKGFGFDIGGPVRSNVVCRSARFLPKRAAASHSRTWRD